MIWSADHAVIDPHSDVKMFSQYERERETPPPPRYYASNEFIGIGRSRECGYLKVRIVEERNSTRQGLSRLDRMMGRNLHKAFFLTAPGVLARPMI